MGPGTSAFVSRFAFGNGLPASPLFLYLGISVLKNDALARGGGKRLHFLTRNHAEANIALPK